MKITEIDKNFIVKKSDDNTGMFWPDISHEPFEICGFPWFDTEKRFVRIPQGKLDQFNDNLKELALHTAGGMLRFRSDSRKIMFEAEILNSGDMSHMPRTGSSGFDFYVGTGKHGRFVKVAMPESGSTSCSCVIEGLSGRMHDWKINFPLYNGVKSIKIGLEEGSKLEKPRPFSLQQPVLFYGSSITQGGCASRPGNAYTHIIGRWLDSAIINLGFSGNAKGEPEMAQLIASLDISAFVMDYDHNAPDVEHLEKTHQAFFDIVRSKKPGLPIILVSKPDFDNDVKVSARRREIIMSTYKAAIKQEDSNVYFIDGQKLFGRTDRDACTVDTCHPNDLGFMRMAKVIYPVVKKALNR